MPTASASELTWLDPSQPAWLLLLLLGQTPLQQFSLANLPVKTQGCGALMHARRIRRVALGDVPPCMAPGPARVGEYFEVSPSMAVEAAEGEKMDRRRRRRRHRRRLPVKKRRSWIIS